MNVKLIRIHENDNGRFGVLLVGGSVLFTSLERRWVNNEKRVSCIPAGEYKCEKIYHSKFGVCYKVLEVPDRDGILIHAGNTVDDTLGCILLGKSYTLKGVADSRKALAEFAELVGGNFNLFITSYGECRRHDWSHGI